MNAPGLYYLPLTAQRRVCAFIAALHGFSEAELFSQSRMGQLTRTRQLAMYVVRRKFPAITLRQIGVLFSRDHSNIHHGIAAVENHMAENPGAAGWVAAVMDAIGDVAPGIAITEHQRRDIQALADRMIRGAGELEPGAGNHGSTASTARAALSGTWPVPLASPQVRNRGAQQGWCEQCDRRVSRGEADACGSPFCKMKGAE